MAVIIKETSLAPYHIVVDRGFDVIQTVTRRKRGDGNKLTDETYLQEKSVGAHTTLLSAVEYILKKKLTGGAEKKAMTLKQYVQELRDLRRSVAQLTQDETERRLEEMYQTVRDLQTRVKQLESTRPVTDFKL